MLANKVVMVTGVGSGLGRALVLAFVQQDCQVVGIARRAETLHETSSLINSDRFSGHVADVADYAGITAVVKEVMNRHGKVELLFNNAAVYPKVNFLDESAADWARTIAVNVNGVANCCKAVLPRMIAAGYGRIFNVGSFADIAPIGNSAAYSASKGAMRALTKSIAMDIGHIKADIEIHEWVPGHLNTQMSQFTGIDPAIAAEWAVRLASTPHARTRNCIFENDREWLPPQGLRQRMQQKLLFWRRSN